MTTFLCIALVVSLALNILAFLKWHEWRERSGVWQLQATVQRDAYWRDMARFARLHREQEVGATPPEPSPTPYFMPAGTITIRSATPGTPTI